MTPRREPDMPDSVKVGPIVYKITDDATDFMRAEHGERQGLYGLSDHKKLLITVNPDIESGQVRATVLHETLHAIIAVSGLSISYEDNERVVSAIEMPLLGVLRDNPEWVAFLVGGTA